MSAYGDSTVRTAWWARWTWRRWHGSCTATGRAIAVVGRRRQPLGALGQPLVDVAHPAPKASRLGGAEQVAVVLEHRPAAGGVDQDRRVTGERRHGALAPAPGRRTAARRGARSAPQQAASPPGQRDPGAGRLDHPLDVGVDVAHPGVHHAAGEQPHVAARRAQAGGPAHRHPVRQAQPAATGAGAPAAGAGPAPSERRPRQQEPVVRKGAKSEAHQRFLPRDRSPGPPFPRPGLALVASIRWPKGTPDGQAVSQPRHCTQVLDRAHERVVGSAPSHCTWRMAAIRPRGDSASSPVTR